MRTKTTMIMNKKLGRTRRRPKRMPYEEPIGRDRDLRSAKSQPPRRTGQKRPKKQPEKATLRGKRCP